MDGTPQRAASRGPLGMAAVPRREPRCRGRGSGDPVSGAPLPETLAECPPGAQAAHWGMAAAVSRLLGHDEPPVPAAVTPEQAERVRLSLSICSVA